MDLRVTHVWNSSLLNCIRMDFFHNRFQLPLFRLLRVCSFSHEFGVVLHAFCFSLIIFFHMMTDD